MTGTLFPLHFKIPGGLFENQSSAHMMLTSEILLEERSSSGLAIQLFASSLPVQSSARSLIKFLNLLLN